MFLVKPYVEESEYSLSDKDGVEYVLAFHGDCINED